MLDTETLGTIAQVGLGLAGFSGIVIVLTSGGAALRRLESDRLGIMLGSSLGATFLALLPLILAPFRIEAGTVCRVASAVMAAYTAGFLRYYVTATLDMRARAPELVTPVPFGSVIAGHGANLLLQAAAAIGLVACAPAYLVGLFWLLFHGAYQFGRVLFIRPRAAAADMLADSVMRRNDAPAGVALVPEAETAAPVRAPAGEE